MVSMQIYAECGNDVKTYLSTFVIKPTIATHNKTAGKFTGT